MDIKALVPLLAQGALFLVMASFGLKTRAGEVLAALRDTSLILRGVLAVNVVVPAVAVVACLLLPIDHSVRIGIVIMAISPLAPVLPAKMSRGEFDTSRAVGLYVALILVAVVLVPLTVALLSAIFPANASLEVTALAKLVGLTVLLPILVGLAIGTWAPGLARPVGRMAAILGFGGIVVLVLLVLYAQGRAIIGLIGDGSVLAIVLTVTAGIVAGHLLGRPDPGRSNALAMAAAVRHPGIAALVVRENFTDRRVMLAVALFLFTSVFVTLIYEFWLRRQDAKATPAAAPA